MPVASGVTRAAAGSYAVQQPVARGPDEGVPDVAVPAVQGEHEPAVVAVVLLPPADVGDRLVLVLVGQVLELVVRHGDREAVGGRIVRQPLGHRPRPQHAVLLEAQVEVELRACGARAARRTGGRPDRSASSTCPTSPHLPPHRRRPPLGIVHRRPELADQNPRSCQSAGPGGPATAVSRAEPRVPVGQRVDEPTGVDPQAGRQCPGDAARAAARARPDGPPRARRAAAGTRRPPAGRPPPVGTARRAGRAARLDTLFRGSSVAAIAPDAAVGRHRRRRVHQRAPDPATLVRVDHLGGELGRPRIVREPDEPRDADGARPLTSATQRHVMRPVDAGERGGHPRRTAATMAARYRDRRDRSDMASKTSASASFSPGASRRSWTVPPSASETATCAGAPISRRRRVPI